MQGFRTKVIIGRRYTGDFGAQINAARRLPPGPPLIVRRRPGLLRQIVRAIWGV